MIRAVVFDLWNTLVHSQEGDPFQHLQEILRPEQMSIFPALKREAMDRRHRDARQFLEDWRDRMDLSGAQVDDMVEVFRRGTADAEPYPEVMEALRRCRQVARLGLLSNTQSFDMEFLESLGISELIPIRHLSCETGFLKPEPAAFEAIQKRMGLFPGELLMVGDSWNDDVSGALEAGWSSIWINRGAWPRPEHDAEAELLELPDLARVPEAVEQLQAGARCSTCLG